MSRCDNQLLISKVGISPLNNTIEVDFSVLTDLENCVRTTTRNPLDYQGITQVFNPLQVPDDLFGCLAEGCKNSGTLIVTGNLGTEVGAVFTIQADATAFAAGLVTYYAYFTSPGTYSVLTTLSDLTQTEQSHADVYTTLVTVLEGYEGFYPIVVDLSSVSDAQLGIGWLPSELGITIGLSAHADESWLIPTIGFSSIFVYDSIEDFEVNDVVKVGCVDEFSGDFTVDPKDASCFGGGYDPATISVERTLTGRSVTPNYWKLNPLTKKGELTTGWLPQTVEHDISEITIEGVTMALFSCPIYMKKSVVSYWLPYQELV